MTGQGSDKAEGGAAVAVDVAALHARIDTLVMERDTAREECGHEKAMRASLHNELRTFIAQKMDRDKRLAAALDLTDRLDPTSGSDRVRTFVADLTRILRGEADA